MTNVAAAYDLLGYVSGSDALFRRVAPRQTIIEATAITVFYGFVVRSKAEPSQHFVVIRGTGDLLEWMKDLQGLPIKHKPSGGRVETGFYTIYESMTYRPCAGKESSLADGVARAISDGRVTVIGHSLGSALSTSTSSWLRRWATE